MASPALRIRVRCPTVCPAPVELEGCTPQTRFADFQSMILKALGRESEQGLSILTGFPPSRPLDMPEDAEIGGKLSDNESVTVRLATQTAGIQQGGKWGRSKRAKTANIATAATTTTSSSSTRSSSRASRNPAVAAGVDDATTATGDADRSSSNPSGGPAGTKKPTGKAKNAGERTAASSGGRKSGSSGGGGGATARGAGSASASSGTSGGGGRAGGVHTLGGPLTPPAASPRRRGSGGGSSGRPGTSPAAAPGQVRTLFGSSAATSGRAAGGSSSSNGAAAAAAARRAGGAAAGSSGSSPSPSAGGGGGGGGAEPDAVATAVAAATGGSGAPRKRPRGTGVQLKSEGDIAERLLTAVGGGGKGTADRFFRKAMKLAVDKQYDQSRADARVRAALGGWYTAEASATQRRLGDGESVALDISFSKGAGAKSQLTETVDRIPREQVSAVVRMIARDPESREMLKPHNFAGCSPRMFWSLVQHWGGDVPAALRLAAPDVDWGFVETRDRKPSEKAVANAAAEEAERLEAEEERAERARAKRKRERRKRRKEGIETDSSEEEKEEEQPHAAESLPSDEVSEEARAASAAAAAADARRRAANAALARLTASQRRPATAAAGGSAAAAAVTVAPVVPATEEENADGVEEKEEEEIDMEGLVEVAGEPGAGLLVAAGLRTLGQLADRDEEDLARQLAALQQQQQQERDAGEGSAAGEGAAADGGAGGGGGGSSGSGEKASVTAEEVSEWVQGARGEELDEIMADIVGGNEDVIEALEEVSVSTPRDLVRMGAFPDVLVGAVRDKVGAERFAPLAGLVTAEAVETWRRKGDRLLEQRPWLELWVHQG
ncbi:unnamed protein product [Ectocarpus sp. 6 AP-2014]